MTSVAPASSLLLLNKPILPRSDTDLSTAPATTEPVEQHPKRARTNVTIAGDGCKTARAKCDGKSPCVRCLKRTLPCTYDQGKDRRQHRGSIEEVQALTHRLVQYQRFIFALRSSSPQTAGHALHQLRSRSNTVIAFQESIPSLRGDTSLAEVVHVSSVDKEVVVDSVDLDEILALIQWVKQDMDITPGGTNRPSPCHEKLSDGNGCNMVGVEVTGPSKGKASLEQLVC